MNFKRILSSLLVVVMLMASFASWAVIGTFAETIANAVVASTPLADVGTAVRGGTSLGFTSMSLLPYEVEEETAVLETEAPELADDTHNFKSDVANQTADFSQSDVWTQLFPWGQNTGGSWYDVTGKGENTVANGAYLLKNYNEMFTQANGKYVFSATIEELADPNRCFMFVRGIRTPIGSGEGQYFGHDGENNHSGCGGIQVSVKDHILQIRIRSWDGKTMTRNDYKVYVNSNKISIADDGETVTIMAGDKAVATVTFSGTRDINGHTSVEKAILTLVNQEKSIEIANAVVAASHKSDFGMAIREHGNYIKFSELSMQGYSTVDVPAVDTAPEAGSTVTIPEFNTYASAGIANEYVVTGTITEIVNASYGNMYITDAEGNKLYIYGMYANADMVFNYGCMNPKPVVGDTITVIGAGTTYKDAPQMKNAILLKIGENDYALDLPAFDATIEFTDVENRTEFSSDKQVWTMNGITLSNTDSKDLKETYYNPIRLYSDSNVTISYTGMKELYIYCQTEYNAEALAGIAIDGATVTADGCIVKIAFKQVTDSVSFTMPAQVRVAYIGVNEIDSLYNSLGDHYYILDETGYAALYEVTITKDNGIGTITLTGEGDLAGTYNWAFDNTAGFVVESDKNLALVYRPMMGGFALQADGMVNPQSLVTKIPVNPYIENVGNHDLIVEDGHNGDAYFFVAPVDGTYTFAYAEGEANGFPMIEYDTSWGMTSETIDFPYTVHLNAGETFILRMGTYDTNPDTINIVISVVYDIDPEDAFYNNLGNDVYYILDETGYAALYEVKFDKEAATVELVGEGDLAGIYNWTYTTAGGFVVESDKEIFIDIIDGTMTLQAIGLVNAAELVTKIPERIVVSDGANVVAATGTGVEVFFTAEKDGTYVISWATGEINGVALIANAEGIYEETALPYEVILLAGETYTFVVATADFSEDEIVVNVAAKSGSGDILDDDDGKGCFGVIGSGALVAVLALVPAAFVLRRKNDEE